MAHKYPPTRIEDIVEEIHGVKVDDPYRWLEDPSSEEVREWVDKQNSLTHSIIEQYPGFETVKKRLTELYSFDEVDRFNLSVAATTTGTRLFYLLREVGKKQFVLYYQDGEEGERILLFDPLTVSEEGLAAVDWVYPSVDGSMVAFGVSEGGTEKSVLHIMRVDTKELLEERIPHTKWCEIQWLNNEGFFYSRYPLPGTVSEEDLNYYHHVYYHGLGDDYRDDERVFGEGRAKTEHPSIVTNADCSLLAIVSNRFTSNDIHVASIDSKSPIDLRFVPVIESDSFQSIPYLDGDRLYLLTQRDAPNGQILRYDLSDFPDTGVIPEGISLIPESDGVKFGVMGHRFTVVDDRIAVIEDKNASSSLKFYNAETGEFVSDIDFGTHVTLHSVVSAPGQDTVYFLKSSFFEPISINSYAGNKMQTVLSPTLDIDTSQFKSEQVWYTSKDGTKVSMFLLSNKGTEFNKETPVTLYGYGGFGISLQPEYRPHECAWNDFGGVYAIANLRGGGEYGLEWHRAGNRENKQNVFDDFAAAAEWLTANEIGSTETIAIAGRSNGGLLVGAALVQRPELYGAVTCHVPLLDMIRYTNFQVAKTWATEYGDPEVKEEFEWILPYSPYHNVKSVTYPPTLFLTALGDTRVDPMHAFKMTARIQGIAERLDQERPVLLFTESETGHGAGVSKERTIEILARAFIFRAHHTGLKIEPAHPEG